MLFRKLILLLLPSKRRALEDAFEEELRSHIEMVGDEALRDGVSPEEARFAARRDLGSAMRIQEDARNVWGFTPLEQFTRDCLYSFRLLRRSPSFTVVAVLSLGIGIGSATAIFSLLNTIILKPLSYRNPEQLVTLREFVAPLSGTYPSLPVNYQHFLFWQQHARSFESLSAVQSGIEYLTGSEPLKVGSAYLSVNWFATFATKPQVGRGFLPEEGRPGRGNVVVITDSLWSRRFGRSPGIVGKSIAINYTPYTIIGVLGPHFRFPKNDELGALIGLNKQTDIFFPLTGSYSDGWGGDYDYAVIGRLKPDVSPQQATAELNILERRIDSEHHLGSGLRVISALLQNVIATPVRTPLYVLMASVLLLLVLVCVNLANLIIARSGARAREFAIRAALGAGQGRLIRQFLIETCLLGVAGGALGLGLAALTLDVFVANTSVQIPRLDEVRIDGSVFMFLLLTSVACGLLAGLAPAVRGTQTHVNESLRRTSHTVAGNRQALRTREVLICCEVAISVILLFGAGLMTSSLIRLLNIDKGFAAEQALDVTMDLPSAHYKTAKEYLRFWEQALGAVRNAPGVQSAAFASKLPLTGESMVDEVTLEGADRSALDPVSQKDIMINVRYVSPDFFATLGIPVVKGRQMEEADRKNAVAVVSARLAAKLWPGRNPIGKKLETGADVGKAEIVGVVKDVHATTLDHEPTLVLYAPYWHRPLGYGSIVVRTAGDPREMIPSLRRTVHALDASLAPPEIIPIRKLVSDSLARRYFQVRLAAAFAGAALALALIGIYGAIAYQAALRRSEVAVRFALGAKRSDVVRLLLQSGLRPVLVGLLVGLVAAVGCGQLIRSVLFGVGATDPLTMLSVVSLLGICAFLACSAPVRRALRTDPASSLRYE